MDKHIEKNAHGGDVYRNAVDLDFSVNINPFGIPAGVKRALIEAIEVCTQYPDAQVEALRTAMAKKEAVPSDCLLFGNGASELFVAIIHAKKPKTVLIPVPSFSGYQSAASCEDCQVRYYYMKKENDFSLTDDFIHTLTAQTETHNAPDLIFLANPNNPTGSCIQPAILLQLLSLCEASNITLVIDECFLEFTTHTDESLVMKAVQSKHLIVVRAFTKIYGMPGVRLGYLVASKENVQQLKKQLPEWNVSLLAQYAGVAALKETDFVKNTVVYVKKQREYLIEQLRALGLTVWAGEADYLLFQSDHDLYQNLYPDLYHALLKKKILIRDCSNYEGLEQGYYRIAVKKEEENKRLIQALKECLAIAKQSVKQENNE